MNKDLLWKISLIVALVVLAIWTLNPPKFDKLKPGIDLAGGTSLMYEINTQGLESHEISDLAQRMITVLRRRIDPAGIQNIIWRPQGDTRFEIQMPLADAETLDKREAYEVALTAIREKNVSPSMILQSLKKATEDRKADFAMYGQNDPNRMEILENLATVYDEQKGLQTKRDQYQAELDTAEAAMEAANINIDLIKTKRVEWSRLPVADVSEAIEAFADPNVVKPYLNTYTLWAAAVAPLTGFDSGVNNKFKAAIRELDKLNLTEEQLVAVLELAEKSADRDAGLERLKNDFKDRQDLLTAAVTAYDDYRGQRGQLDDPKDLQRMLKGAGILEFRILPQVSSSALSRDQIEYFVESLASKGPQYASTSEYQWFELEDQELQSVAQWANPQGGMAAVVGQFGKKYYVLASNSPSESMLHTPGQKDWKLEKAQPSNDRMGRRAIGFTLNDKGAIKFAELTGNNLERPLCILLDDIAISAPNISSKIDKSGVITGSFTDTAVADMVNKLNAGSLPARLIEQPISVKNIGPSIGESNRDEGIKAGIIGLIVVIVIMGGYYLAAGVIANLALVCNILFVLAIMCILEATFTLPGIAGIILTIGMSVDANVLIFERIREEQAKGSSLRVAIKNGYERAFRTIFDANVTTFITAAILYWVASEEIKGFAIVLMLGIVCSMFTALFVTRVIFEMLLDKKLIQGELKMMRLIHEPKINWMGSRPVFFAISSILIIAGLLVFFTRDSGKYDIEFTGGTAAQLNFTEPQNRDDVEATIREAGIAAGSPALGTAYVYSVGDTGKEFEVTTTETNKTSSTLTLGSDATDDSIIKAIKKTQDGGKLSNLRVTALTQANTFEVATSQVNQEMVKNVLTEAFPNAQTMTDPTVDEIVNNTIETAFGDKLEKQNDLGLANITSQRITDELANENPMLASSADGVQITCTLNHAATPKQINKRIKNLRFKPDMRDLVWYPYPHSLLSQDLTALAEDQAVTTFVYVSMPPEAGLRTLSPEEWTQFESNETRKIKSAASLATSLPRVTQIDPSVGGEQQKRAIIAIILSLSAIVGYIWIRFGDLRYGLAAIIALVHDVSITLGAVVACFYLAGTFIGDGLLISDFKINLGMIAAFLTLIGYSLNDTIVVFDRIRENRHKAQLTPQTITNSINQTISRTLMTSFTTFVVVLVMYIFGGEGLRGFTFAIGLGVIVGTYSSIAIAAPVLLIGNKVGKNSD